MVKNVMAELATSDEYKWPNIQTEIDISPRNYYCYQRRYPTRLPKLVTGSLKKKIKPFNPSISRNSSQSNCFDRSLVPTDETMALKANEKQLLAKRKEHSITEKIPKQIETLTLEDFVEEDAVNDEIVPHNSNQPLNISTENKVVIDIDDVDRFLLHKTQNRVRSNSTPINLIKAPKNGERRHSELVTVSPTKTLKQKKRSKSVYEPSILTRPLKSRPTSSSKVSRSQLEQKRVSFNFISQLRSKTESSAINSLTRNIKERKRSSIISHNKSEINNIGFVTQVPKSEENYKNMDPLLSDNNDVQPECPNIVEDKLNKLDASVNTIKKSDWSDRVCLDMDYQMKFLEDRKTLTLPERHENGKLMGEPITLNTAKALRSVLFGSFNNSFNLNWREQSLIFNRVGHYGLKFYKDSPVEIMASLQAFVMKQFLFLNVDPTQIDLTERLKPTAEAQLSCLRLAMCDMIWKAGHTEHAVVAIPLGKCTFVSDCGYRKDKITEKMQLFKFTNSDELEKFMRYNFNTFQDSGGCGCISLLYSIILSRGLSKLFDDFKELGHGMLENIDTISRSQALINLCIYGMAVPNVFNGYTEEFDETKDESVERKGIIKRCEIGFLAHQEFVDSKTCTVGSCLKTPLYPIWVCNNNNRLCVLFSLKRDLLNDWKAERRFDLYHYQGIPRFVGCSELDVKLTLDTILPFIESQYEEDDNSTLEETIRTKWKDTVIEWNGYVRF